MCLITTDIERKIADKDIKVFKIFREDNKSLYQEFDYTPFIGKQFDDPEEEDVDITIRDPLYDGQATIRISGGFVHSFSDYSYAKQTLMEEEYSSSFYNNDIKFVLRECTISKGTEYYYSDRYDEYASKSLIIGEICA